MPHNEEKRSKIRGFNHIFNAELALIRMKRGCTNSYSYSESEQNDVENLSGISLSGGGVRSASVCLGALQCFSNRGVLKSTDYLSTVSGGGFIGASYILAANNQTDKSIFPFEHSLGQKEPLLMSSLRKEIGYIKHTGIGSAIGHLLKGLLLNFVLPLPLLILFCTLIVLIPYWDISQAAILIGTNYSNPTENVTQLLPIKTALVAGEVSTYVDFTLSKLLFFISACLTTLHLLLGVGNEKVDRRNIANLFRWTLRLSWATTIFYLCMELSYFYLQHLLPFGSGTSGLQILTDYLKKILLIAAILITTLITIFILLTRTVSQSKLGKFFSLTTLALTTPVFILLVIHSFSISLLVLLELSFDRFKRDFHGADTKIRWLEKFVNQTYEIIHWPLDFVYCGSQVENCKTVLFGEIAQGNYSFQVAVILLIAIFLFALTLCSWLFYNANYTSLHNYFKSCIQSCFLKGEKLGDAKPTSLGNLHLSKLTEAGYPYLIINATENTEDKADYLSEKGRNFVLSPLYSGSENNYVRTKRLEGLTNNVTIGSFIAISAAASSPLMGALTHPSISGLLTSLNLRLGYWMPNPSKLRENKSRPGVGYLLREFTGKLTRSKNFVHLSDGGHYDNLGAVELLRRKCKLIYIIDAEQDDANNFAGLSRLVEASRILFGYNISIDTSKMRNDENGQCTHHWSEGTVQYSPTKTGKIIYIKSSLSGDENPYIKNYNAENKLFPHEKTIDQFFTHSQFEAYRSLGYHLVNSYFSESPRQNNS